MPLTPRRAVAAFALADKAKSGLIWASAGIETAAALEGPARQGGLTVARGVLDMVTAEILCARRLTGDAAWDEVVRILDRAQVMIRSGVPQDAPYHLTRALRVVAGIGQRAGDVLTDARLF